MSGRMSLLVTVKGFGSGGEKPSGAFTGSFTCMLSPESRCVAKVDLHGSRPVQTRPLCIVRAAISRYESVTGPKPPCGGWRQGAPQRGVVKHSPVDAAPRRATPRM